ncbi:MAG: hypothetical protein ACHQKY_10465 [Terriglobia bacterium]
MLTKRCGTVKERPEGFTHTGWRSALSRVPILPLPLPIIGQMRLGVSCVDFPGGEA